MARERVIVGMSGGVDSSVAAALLVRDGYEVLGVTLRTHSFDLPDGREHSCCTYESIQDARNIARMLGFRHEVWDVSAQFDEYVIRPFIQSYQTGTTPNPCVICNRVIKWDEILRRSSAYDIEYIATGHYARIAESSGRWFITEAADSLKDQSYALWGLSQENLKHTILPLGGFTKQQIRNIAKEMNLPTASKKESFEICFIPDDDYEGFLKSMDPELAGRVSGGSIVYHGETIGKHRGYPFYTIGQRRGLGIATGAPVYVTRIDPITNTIEVDDEPALYHSSLIAADVNWQKISGTHEPLRGMAKVRYKDEAAPAQLFEDSTGNIRVEFESPKRAITPGQSIVMYDENDPGAIVAGGIILKAE